MLKSNINKVVVCPGSRNAPLVHNFKAAGMECYEITDERSAGFFAIGLIEANNNEPVAVCCTSGSAVVNLAPAVVEAYYRPLPLFVITADRPEKWIGQMDGQTMVQPGAFANYIRKTVSLPEPRDEEEKWYCNRLINEAIFAMNKFNGPVHVNVPITEPMFDFSAEEMPDERLIRAAAHYSYCLNSNVSSYFKTDSRVMVVLGQLHPKELTAISGSLREAANAGWVILAENLSNIHIDDVLREYVISNFDDVLVSHTPAAPDILISLGGHIVSKRLKKYLRTNSPKYHISVSPYGEVIDTFQCVTDVIDLPLVPALSAIVNECPFGGKMDYVYEWKRELEKEKLPFLEALFERLPKDWTLHVANSSMVRKVQKVFSSSNPVFCNRGINGIEGSVSAAVGYWAGSKKPTLLLTGDLSFFYDQNALWNTIVKSDKQFAPLRIIIINNGGGEIFYGLPGLKNSPYLAEAIAASHQTNAEGIAKECGCEYYSAASLQEYVGVLNDFLSNDNGPKVLEVFTNSY